VVPAATEIVTALGAVDSLVGVSHECALAAGLAPRPRVTASALARSETPGEINAQVAAMSGNGTPLFRLLSAEIAALRPDVIITQGLCHVCAVSEEDVRALASRLAPTPRVVSISGSTLDDVFNDIGTVATALDLHGEADRLLASLRARMKRVHEVLSAARAPRPRTAVLEWTDPPFAAGHWVPEMVYRAGGTDVLAVAGQHSRAVSWKALTQASPAVVLIAPCGYGIDRAAREGRHLIDRSPWLQRRTVWALDACDLVSQPGPRLVDGIETMAAILHPDLFETPPVSRAVPLVTR
jgi:iron complex transport system substrate-binding protein